MIVVSPAHAILNGYKTTDSKFPWAVAVVTRGTDPSACTGVLIQPKVVLTAAHCGFNSTTKVYSNWGHTNSIAQPSNHSSVLSGPPVSRYNSHTGLHDVAVLKLASPLPATPLPLSDVAVKPGMWLTATGFGCDASLSSCSAGCNSLQSHFNFCFEHETDDNHIGLRAVALQVVTSGCQRETASAFCTYSGAASVMHGDSGGPVMLEQGGQWRLVGLIDTYKPTDTVTGTKYHDGITSIATELGWINSVLNGSPPSVGEAPPSEPRPPSPSPPVETPSPPGGEPLDRHAITSYDRMNPGAPEHGYFEVAWQAFTAESNTVTELGITVGNPALPAGAAVPYDVTVRLCSAQPASDGACPGQLVETTPEIVNYGPTLADVGEVAVTQGAAYWIEWLQPVSVDGTTWVTYWWAGGSFISTSEELQALVRGYNR
jgi:hypothetical protein